MTDAAEVPIPDDWEDLSWQDKRSLAAKLSSEPIRNMDDADIAIEEALGIRDAMAMQPVTLEIKPDSPLVAPHKPVQPLTTDIPDDWEDLPVDAIIDLARRIKPDGNPVDVIREELARRGGLN